MKFYFVGSIFNTPADQFIKRRLFSYWSKPLNDARRCTANGDELFLDSGAFSAFTNGVEIDIERYAEFIHASDGIWDHVANLDCIPGNGVTPTSAAEKSYRNLRYLESLGCKVVPCFHAGEPYRYLERYIERYDYIALGGMVKGRRDLLQNWLDWCWLNYLTHEDGRPRVKVHGFGLSSYWAATRYPWYSLDSTSWLYDSVRRPEPICRVWINDRPVVIDVRNQSLPSRKLEARFGVTARDCRTDRDACLLVNAAYYKELENHVPDRFLPRAARAPSSGTAGPASAPRPCRSGRKNVRVEARYRR